MAKRMIIMLIGVSILFGLIFGFYFFKQHKIQQMMSGFRPAATAVTAAEAKQVTWQDYITSVGSITAINGVDVTTQSNGLITNIAFTSGSMVNKGDVLIDMDDRTEVAELKNYNAQLKLAELTYKRSLDLYNKGAESKSTLDSDKASLEEAQANVESTEAKIDRYHIKAPFSGKIGIRQVNLGEYIQPGTAIASLQSLDPLYVQFYINEQNIKDLHVGQAVEVTSDAYPGEIYKGTVTAINSTLSSESRSVSVIATIPNEKATLLPNMFAHVHVMLPEKKDIIVLPQTAISYNLYGNSVYIIKPSTDKKGNKISIVKLTYIKVGERRGSEAEVISGVNAGDQVISSGQLKLDDGVEVKVTDKEQ